MHAGGSHSKGGHGSGRTLAQGEADTCCALSEPDRSAPSPQGFSAPALNVVLEPATAHVLVPPQRPIADGWRTTVPVPRTPVPRHVLLSVFLI
jgi:hypothetical protein